MPPTIEEIMLKVPAKLLQPEFAGTQAVIHFKFTGAQAGEWNAVLRDGKCDVARGIPRQKPNLSLSVDSGEFMRILGGELDGVEAFMAGTIKIAGDMELARRLMQAFTNP